MHRRLEQSARPIFQQIPEIDQNGERLVGDARWWRLARRINRHTRPVASLRANLQPRLPRELEEQRHGPEIGVRARADVDVGFVLWCAGVVQQAQHGAGLAAGGVVAGGKPFFVREGEGARELPEERLAEGVAGVLEGDDIARVRLQGCREGLLEFAVDGFAYVERSEASSSHISNYRQA